MLYDQKLMVFLKTTYIFLTRIIQLDLRLSKWETYLFHSILVLNHLWVSNLLHNILLTLGIFSTDIDLTLNQPIGDIFRYLKPTFPNDDEYLLRLYSFKLSMKFIDMKIKYFPNAMHVIDKYIIIDGEFFEIIMINYEWHISDIPPSNKYILAAST